MTRFGRWWSEQLCLLRCSGVCGLLGVRSVLHACLALALVWEGAAFAAPVAGERIWNRAVARYLPDGSSAPRAVYSNSVETRVLPVHGVTLSASPQLHAVAGSHVVVVSVLTNTGNVASDYRLALDAGDCAADQPRFASERIFLDRNGNGVVDADDLLLISAGDVASARGLPLLPNERAHLLTEVRTPEHTSSPLHCVRIYAHDVPGDVHAASHVRVRVSGRAALRVTQSVRRGTPTALGQPVGHVRVTARSEGARDALPGKVAHNGAAVAVDGTPTALIVVRVHIPREAAILPETVRSEQPGVLLLYHLATDAPFSFRTAVPTGAVVDEVAVGLSQPLPAGEQRTLAFSVQLPANAETEFLAQAHYHDGVAAANAMAAAVRLRLSSALKLSLAASPPFAHADALGRPDGTATVRFQAALRNDHHAKLHDVGISHVLERLVPELGAYTSAEAPVPGQYTIVANSLHVVEHEGMEGEVVLNSGFTGQAEQSELLGPRTSMPSGAMVRVQYDVRLNLQDLPAQLLSLASAHAALVSGQPAMLRILSVDGPHLAAVGEQTIGQGTPVDTRVPVLRLQKMVAVPRPVSGESGQFDLDYAVAVTNAGLLDVTHVRLLDNLSCALRTDQPDSPVAQWQLLGPPRADAGLLAAASGYTGVGPCDTREQALADPVAALPSGAGLALVDGAVALPPGATDTLRFTVRVRLRPQAIGVPHAVSNRAWVGVLQPVSGLLPTQLAWPRAGDHLVRSTSAAQAGSQLLEPTGVVYDAVTRRPVAGAQVSLARQSCDAGEAGSMEKDDLHEGVGRYDFHADGRVSTTTDASGQYMFALNHAPERGLCTYALQVTPPAGSNLRYPSQQIPAQPQAFAACGAVVAGTAAPQAGEDTTYHHQLVQGVDTSANAVCNAYRNNIPLDPAASPTLGLLKVASADTVVPGDLLDYQLTLSNYSAGALSALTVFDRLPPGMRYVPGSARLGGQPLADPVASDGTTVQFSLGTYALPVSGVQTLRYTVRVGVGAPMGGDAVNLAWAVSGATAPQLRSNDAVARVKVLGGVFSSEAFAFGKVFWDCNGNGVQDDAEAGQPGVALYMENGTRVVSDSAGKWSLYGLRALTHVLRLDRSTLPPGALLSDGGAQRSSAESVFLDLSKGELHKANFALQGCQAPPPAAATSSPTPTLSDEGAGAAPAGLEDTLAGLDPELAFLNLQDGQTVTASLFNVRVKGPDAGSMVLRLNGVMVDEARVGKRVFVDASALQAWEYVAVPLQPGLNTLELQQIDAFGNARGSRAVRVTAPGALARIELELPATAVADPGKPVPVRVLLLDAQGLRVADNALITVKADGVQWDAVDQNPLEPGLQLQVQDGGAQLQLIPPQEPGDAHLQVSYGTLSADAHLSFLPDLRPLRGVGVVEGVLHFDAEKGLPWGDTAANAFESELQGWSRGAGEQVYLAARSALYFKGAVSGAYLLTLAYDSDKPSDAPLFRDIQPDRFYPVYGDSSEKTFDAPSSQRLYLRIDHDRSYLLVGDYRAQTSPEVRRLSQVSGKHTGAQHVYQDARTRISSHASQDALKQVVQEFPANGTSGPFVLDVMADPYANSETVQIVVRDRSQPNSILSTRQLKRFADYRLDALSRTLRLMAPLASFDPGLNPQSIRVTYAVRQGSAVRWVGGVDVQHKLTDSLQLGGVVERDEAPGEALQLTAATLLKTFDDQTVLRAELVQTQSDARGEGAALGIELKHEGAGLDYRLQVTSSDAEFFNPAAAIVAGQTDVSLRWKHALLPDMDLQSDLRYSAVNAPPVPSADSGVHGAGVSVLNRWGPYVSTELGLRSGQSEAPAARGFDYAATSGSLALPRPAFGLGNATPAQPYLGAHWRVAVRPPALAELQLFVEGEHDLDDSSRQRAAIGSNYALTPATRVYGRYEVISSLGNDYALTPGVQRNLGLVGLDSAYMEGGRVYDELRIADTIDGRALQAAMGVRNTWRVAPGWRLGGSLEQQRSWVGGNTLAASDARVATGSADWFGDAEKHGLVRASASAEVRTATHSVSHLLSASGVYKLGSDWSALARASAHRVTRAPDNSLRRQQREQIGLAYRPLHQDRWNSLLRYEHKFDDHHALPFGASLADSAGAHTHTHIVSAHLNYQPALRHQFSTRLAARSSSDQRGPWQGRYTATLWHGRWRHQLNERWDVGLQTAQWFDVHGTTQRSYGAELGYRLAEGFWLSAGYNVLGLRDAELAGADYTDRGSYLRLRIKFDETTFQSSSFQ